MVCLYIVYIFTYFYQTRTEIFPKCLVPANLFSVVISREKKILFDLRSLADKEIRPIAVLGLINFFHPRSSVQYRQTPAAAVQSPRPLLVPI